MTNLMHHPLLIIDFGSQYTQLIGRRIREMGVYCEIHPWNLDESYLHDKQPCGIILSGGPTTVTVAHTPRAPEWVFNAGLPILGICYGMQTMALQLGGEVVFSDKHEYGHAEVILHGQFELFENIEDRIGDKNARLLDVWMSHGDQVARLPSGFSTLCSTANTGFAGMVDESRHWYGLQFHPEVTHTPQGQRILKRFVIDICQAETTWTTTHILQERVENIRRQVGDERVLLALSGGVDSSVVAALLKRAIGDRLMCVFVDTGLLRLNEARHVEMMFKDHLGVQLKVVRAEAQFFEALQGVTCPEEKRKIIGRLFIDVFEKAAQEIGKITWLAQGTIYPDVIESAAVNANGASVIIKSHHNVGGLPETLQLKLLEPIRELFKDEVRQLGMELGLPSEMVYRHPFPGPGLGVRVLGEVKQEYVAILRQADAIFIEELRLHGFYQHVSQAFAVFLPVKSVGVKGDDRHYDYVICLRSVETTDFMTAKWSELPWSFLANVSNRIMNEVPHVSRVTYDISGKPPATIEWE